MTLDSPDQVWFLVIAITCIAIPGLFLIVRVYTKLAIVRMFEIADYFIFVAFPLIIVEIVFGYYAVKWGAGVHQWQVSFGQLFNQLYWLNVAEITYCPLSFLVKMAILFQYLRLFAPDRKNHRFMWYGAWVMIIACFIFYTVFTFWTAFYCYPREMIWNKFLQPAGKCHDHSPIVMNQGAFNMASDIIILLLPTASLWQLNVPLARKIVITLLFGTGLLACAASAMRIAFTVKIEDVFRKADVSHNGFYIGLWTMIEVALGFVVACSLSLPRLIQAKGRKVKIAITSPFSTLRGTVTGSSPNSTMNSQSGRNEGLDATMERSLGSQRAPTQSMRSLNGSLKNGKQPMIYKERELNRTQGMRHLNPIQEHPHDLYRQPTPSASSQYSSKRNSEERGVGVAPLNISHIPPHPGTSFPGTPGLEAPPRHSFHANEYTAAAEPWNSDPWSVSTTDLHSIPVRQNSVPPRKPLAPTSTIDARISRWPSKLDTNRDTHRSLAPEPDSTSASEHYTTPRLEPHTFVPHSNAETRISRWPSKLEHAPAPTPERQDTPTNDAEGRTMGGAGGEILLARSYSNKSRRMTTELMTIEQIEHEMNTLQQFRFETVKQSLDRAREGSRGREV